MEGRTLYCPRCKEFVKSDADYSCSCYKVHWCPVCDSIIGREDVFGNLR